MKKYIRTNLVQAEPQKKRVKLLPVEEFVDGYRVVYADGYESWCPKDQFEAQALEVAENNTIPKELVDFFMNNAVLKIQTVDGKTTIVHAVFPNGFTMVESSSCVDPMNYDEKLGTEICVERMKNQLWGLLGFMLQTAKDGVNKSL